MYFIRTSLWQTKNRTKNKRKRSYTVNITVRPVHNLLLRIHLSSLDNLSNFILVIVLSLLLRWLFVDLAKGQGDVLLALARMHYCETYNSYRRMIGRERRLQKSRIAMARSAHNNDMHHLQPEPCTSVVENQNK